MLELEGEFWHGDHTVHHVAAATQLITWEQQRSPKRNSEQDLCESSSLGSWLSLFSAWNA